ncbi:MAG TPA: DUF3299 domain-containing protein [Nitrosospira sp.]|nr:DUF3299 domain-containing protein [Nitrosospira sp.]
MGWKMASMLRLSFARFFVLILSGCFGVIAAQSAAAAENKDYKIGERLSAPAGNAKNNPAPGSVAPVAYKEKTWDDLMPKNWDPMAPLKGLKLDQLKDSDPRAIEALEKIRDAWKTAPVERALEGERIRIPGFVIPLERTGNKVREFLLVPYFGACIHTPPPPSNQIIHVRMAKPASNMRTMDTMWVSGVMRVGNMDTEMGQAGYQLKADRVVPYP